MVAAEAVMEQYQTGDYVNEGDRSNSYSRDTEVYANELGPDIDPRFRHRRPQSQLEDSRDYRGQRRHRKSEDVVEKEKDLLSF